MILDKNRELPFCPDPIYRPPPRPPKTLQPQNSESKADTSPKIDIEFKENSPYQEGIISKAYQRPDKILFSRTYRIRKFSKHKQIGTKISTEAD